MPWWATAGATPTARYNLAWAAYRLIATNQFRMTRLPWSNLGEMSRKDGMYTISAHPAVPSGVIYHARRVCLLTFVPFMQGVSVPVRPCERTNMTGSADGVFRRRRRPVPPARSARSSGMWLANSSSCDPRQPPPASAPGRGTAATPPGTARPQPRPGRPAMNRPAVLNHDQPPPGHRKDRDHPQPVVAVPTVHHRHLTAGRPDTPHRRLKHQTHCIEKDHALAALSGVLLSVASPPCRHPATAASSSSRARRFGF